MAKNATIIKNRYDKAHMKQFLLKLHLVNDADIIEKFGSVPNMQGYVKQLVRDDIARTRPGCVPVSLSGAALSILAEKAKETGRSVPEIVTLILNEKILRNYVDESDK